MQPAGCYSVLNKLGATVYLLCLPLTKLGATIYFLCRAPKQNWGRHGFDMGRETFGACRGVEFLLKPATKVIVANDDNYALAA